jgi:putative ABC transport system substrate-binding protein
MRRRAFGALVALATVARARTAAAQRPGGRRLVAMLWAGIDPGSSLAETAVETFTKRLRDLGWAEPQNVQIEHRWVTRGGQQTRELALELVQLRPDVLVVNSTPLLAALLVETSLIPIVFVRVADPVGQGLVASLARPGGNATGFTNFESAIGGKWLELLREVLPQTKRVAVLYNPRTVPYAIFLRSIAHYSARLSIDVIRSEVESAGEIETAVLSASGEPKAAMIVLPDIFNIANRALIIEMARRTRLCALYPYSFFVEVGGFISYGIDGIAVYGDAATYVDRILRGALPAELPVQASTKFELAINLRTAAELGIDLPTPILARADKVVE